MKSTRASKAVQFMLTAFFVVVFSILATGLPGFITQALRHLFGH